MMSSEISTDARPGSIIRPWHFFLLTAILAATVGVLLSRGKDPSHVIFGSIAIFAASLIGIAVHRVLSPLVSPEVVETTEMLGGRTRAALEREKMLVLRSIKELEFDRAMGKLSAADFSDMASRLRARAVGLIHQLDQGGTGYRELIERELAVRLATPAAGAPPSTPQQAILRSATSNQAEPAPTIESAGRATRVQALRCESCRTLNDLDARFCKGCGQPL